MTKRYKAERISRTYKISTLVGVLLAAFTLVCRWCTPLADWYATLVYPVLSTVLSWLASGVAFNLEEPAIGLLIAAFLAIIVMAVRRRWGFGRCLRYELTLLLWTYVWFYMGWCVNYSRSSIYARTLTQPTEFDEQVFRAFLGDYTEQINAAWTADTITDRLVLEDDVKAFYAHVPVQYGLATPRPWHHPKRILLNSLYSQSGILGFMAPLFAESCLNADLLAVQLPSTYAHEYAHLMGVSSEAEASWWAYQACTASDIPAVRYSGYLAALPYVANDAYAILTDEEYFAWLQSLHPGILADLNAEQEHWQSLRSEVVREVHQEVFDTFLKSNNVEAGRQDYSLVIRLLIDLKY